MPRSLIHPALSQCASCYQWVDSRHSQVLVTSPLNGADICVHCYDLHQDAHKKLKADGHSGVLPGPKPRPCSRELLPGKY